MGVTALQKAAKGDGMGSPAFFPFQASFHEDNDDVGDVDDDEEDPKASKAHYESHILVLFLFIQSGRLNLFSRSALPPSQIINTPNFSSLRAFYARENSHASCKTGDRHPLN